MNEDKLLNKLHKVFELFEKMFQDSLIKHYGLATFTCFRTPPNEKSLYLNLQKVVHVAEAVGGPHHNFKFIEAPINIAMPEIIICPWQSIDSNPAMKDNSNLVLLAAANRLRVNLISCQPLAQGRVVKLKLNTSGLKDVGAAHIQFIRSIPARCLVSTLVGMKGLRHTINNLQVATVDPLPSNEFAQTLKNIRP